MTTSRSRSQFSEYRQKLADRQGTGPGGKQRKGDATKLSDRTFGQLLLAFLKLLRGHRTAVAVSLGSLTVATLLKLAPPGAIKLAVDYVLPADQMLPPRIAALLPAGITRFQLLLLLAIGVVLISLSAAAIHLGGRWFATKTVNRVQVSLRKRAFEHAVHLPLHKVYELKSGGAASLLREDAGGAAELVFSMLYNPWRAIVQLAGSLAVLVFVDWRMLLGGLMMVPAVYFTHRTWIRRVRPLWRDVRKQRERIDAASTESFGGIRIVRGFTRERSETNRFARSNNLLVRKQLFVWIWSRIIEVIWDTIIPLASTALLVYGGYRIIEGQMTLGDLTMFLFYLAMLLEPLATLVATATAFQNNLAGWDRILDLLDEPREMPARPHAASLTPNSVEGRIEFRDVGFRYPGTSKNVLTDISLEVSGGETIALVGRSGAGKTTLCNLVARFYDPTAGAILFDNRDLRDIHVDSYRRLLGIVEQDVFLFDGTIAENIGYGHRGATQVEVQQAAELANAHEFVTHLEDGYDTLIGERGVKLSGGQRQRLAIARALLADPRILILDEATSNLDSESEQLIQQSLRTLMYGRTCFVIAHRMSTIGLADRIAVLDHGRLVAVGAHEQLVQENAVYQKMVQLQTISGADALDLAK